MQRTIDVLFVMDATASMKDALVTCKGKTKEVVGIIGYTTRFSMRVGLVAYRYGVQHDVSELHELDALHMVCWSANCDIHAYFGFRD
jgi:hypothetical protein